MRSADHYEALALTEMDRLAEAGRLAPIARAQVYATLAQAAAIDDLRCQGLTVERTGGA